MKKIISLVLAMICLFSLAACGGEEADIDVAKVKEQIINDLGVEGALDIDTASLLDLYGIVAEDVEESACYVTMDGVFPQEVILVKAVSQEAAKRVSEKLNVRIDEVKIQSQSYDAENYALAQECKVIVKGNVVAMFLSPQHAEMEKIFGE